MCRGKLHCVVAAVALVGFLAFAPSQAEAAGGAPVGSDFWSHALRWVASWWEGADLVAWDDKGGASNPNGSDNPGGPPSSSNPGGEGTGDQGWMIDPNG